MAFHRGDPVFIKLFVKGIHQHNIDISTGQELLNNYSCFVEYMRKHNEYLPEAPSIKVVKEFYKHQAPNNAKFWTDAKDARLKDIKPWLVAEYNSRIALIKQENQQSEDLDIDIVNGPNFPPKINENINNSTDLSINLLGEKNTPTESMEISMSQQNSANNDDIIIVNRRKKRKYSKRELDSETESEDDINDFDLSFKSNGFSPQNMRNRIQQRREEEEQLEYSRNQQKLQAVRNNTGRIVADLINSAIPTIIDNAKITEILAEEKHFKQKQEKINNAIIANLKKFKNSTEQYFGIIDAKLNKIIDGMQPRRQNRPTKRKRIDMEYNFD